MFGLYCKACTILGLFRSVSDFIDNEVVHK
jgi:hypothetical protein